LVLYSDWVGSSDPYDSFGINPKAEMKLKVYYRFLRREVGWQGWAWWKFKYCFVLKHWSTFKRNCKMAWDKQWDWFWCGMCGSTHKVSGLDFFCFTINEKIEYKYVWRLYQAWDQGTIYNEGKHDIFIAWDNLAKHNGTFEQKLQTEKNVWTMMFNNAYDKHKNGQEKIKGCKDCQKSDLHKPDFEKTYLTASWRE